jgi:hypothetical protein
VRLAHAIVYLLLFDGLTGAREGRLTEGDAAAPAPWSLSGTWELNTARTHYGSSADPRRRERFSCTVPDRGLTCRIEGERTDGRHVVGQFSVAASGVVGPVGGVPGVDSVRLRSVSPSITDATFYFQGSPAFGYRAYLANDEHTLTVVTVHPVSRRVLSTVVSYDRR